MRTTTIHTAIITTCLSDHYSSFCSVYENINNQGNQKVSLPNLVTKFKIFQINEQIQQANWNRIIKEATDAMYKNATKPHKEIKKKIVEPMDQCRNSETMLKPG